VLKAVCIELASAQIVILDLSTYATSGLVSDVVASQLTVSDLLLRRSKFKVQQPLISRILSGHRQEHIRRDRETMHA